MQFHGVGRRKKAVARVFVKPGAGNFTINGKSREHYFTTDEMVITTANPLLLLNQEKLVDVNANVFGGGLCAQADAIALGISRAFLSHDESNRPVLRQAGLLTVDSRVKERKKYGQKGARAKFQFVKR